jgi:hypothetical protein
VCLCIASTQLHCYINLITHNPSSSSLGRNAIWRRSARNHKYRGKLNGTAGTQLSVHIQTIIKEAHTTHTHNSLSNYVRCIFQLSARLLYGRCFNFWATAGELISLALCNNNDEAGCATRIILYLCVHAVVKAILLAAGGRRYTPMSPDHNLLLNRTADSGGGSFCHITHTQTNKLPQVLQPA